MPTPITPSPTWSALQGPAGGDLRSSASVRDMGQRLANRIELLALVSFGYIDVPLGSFYNLNSRFSANAGALAGWQQTDITSAGELVFPVSLPPIGTIFFMRAYVHGGTGRAGLPATKPAFALTYTNLATGAEVGVISATTDPSASQAAYETAHSWDALGGGHVLDSERRYWAKFTGEAGANASANKLRLLNLRIALTFP